MSVKCANCGRVLDYSGDPPAFCMYCGEPLAAGPVSKPLLEATEAAPTPVPPDQTPTVPPRAAGAPGAGESLPGVGAILGGYRLKRPLGSGGMGSVYEAEHTATGRNVAVKVVAASVAGSEETVERFRQEGRLASMVVHPRCVFVLGADEEAGRPFIVMELMPGSTLKDLVDRVGPLPIEQAMAHILDVIDGLQEAHRIGVIHRDVKPSNCFLDAEGRVKIGDFGLSKSLLRSTHLTQTGSFLGTPLYASPEQVRGERVDAQSDVYSVAATLYYLLCGRAPFEGGDAAVTLARIAADPVPPLRALRSGLPAALEQAVLRGLERERGRRWRNLEEFRAALLPFVPGQLAPGSVGLRFAAYLLDHVFMMPATVLAFVLQSMPETEHLAAPIASGLMALYYWIQEGLWGATLAKRLLRLRVSVLHTCQPPGLARAGLRSLTWYALMMLGVLPQIVMGSGRREKDPVKAMTVAGAALGFQALSIGLIVCTMRRRNGYQCLHDVLSRTRVVQLPETARRTLFPELPVEWPVTKRADLPKRLGSFEVLGQIHTEGDREVLLGEDLTLGRKVLIVLGSTRGGEPGPSRREVGRPGRLRWLTGGTVGNRSWDAFLAPAGSPLPALVAASGRLSWHQVRPVLEQLTDELTAAQGDQTMPRLVSDEQVWVQPDGRIQLLEESLQQSGQSHGKTTDPAEVRSPLGFVRAAARFMLEGRRPLAGKTEGPVRAPVPGHAAALLQRPYRQLSEFRADLDATAARPTRLNRSCRGAHLALQAAFLWVGLSCVFFIGSLPNFSILALSMQSQLGQWRLTQLQTSSRRELAVALANPEASTRLTGVVLFASDEGLARQLEQVLEREQREHEARLHAQSWYTRWAMRYLEQEMKKQVDPQLRNARPLENVRLDARSSLVVSSPGQVDTWLALLAFWPAVWVVWAFVFRGGFTFRLTGIALVRRDGRKASRLQCAWRALLVWAPFLALTAASVVLEARYWETWNGSEEFSPLLWLAWLLWWAGLGLLPGYLGLALWNPERSWHDRLAGTYLVPR